MYQPKYTGLEPDVYNRCVEVASAYYTLLRRRKEMEEEIIYQNNGPNFQPAPSQPGNPTANKAERLILCLQENDRKIHAVEQAWHAMVDETARQVIRYNLFEGIPLKSVNLPMSERSMKRCRKLFLTRLAQELHEII